MDCRWPVLVILDTAHKPFTDTLVEDENDLGSDLGTEKHCFLHSMSATCLAGGTRASGPARCVTASVRSSACTGTGGIGIAVLLPFGEVLGRLESLHGGRGLEVASRTMM